MFSSPCLKFSRVTLFQIALCGFATPAFAATAPLEPIESVEKAASDWIKVRAETMRIESEWRTERGLLEAVIIGLKERAAALEENRDHVKASTADERADLASLRDKNLKAEEELNAATKRVEAIALKLLQLRPALPPKLSEGLEMAYRSIANPELGAGERMQHTMTILNRCAQFNRLVSCGDEVITVDGTPKSLQAIYWGLSHGYALDRATSKVWYGQPTAGKWQWQPLEGGADEVARLIAIYNDKADPEFVLVPARLASTSAR